MNSATRSLLFCCVLQSSIDFNWPIFTLHSLYTNLNKSEWYCRFSSFDLHAVVMFGFKHRLHSWLLQVSIFSVANLIWLLFDEDGESPITLGTSKQINIEGFRTWCFLIRTTSTEPTKWQLEISGLPQKIINNCLTTAFWKLQCIRQRKLYIEIQIRWSSVGELVLYSY